MSLLRFAAAFLVAATAATATAQTPPAPEMPKIAPVEELDPLAGIAAAQECGVTRDEALTSFTAAPAWLEGAEDRRGRLSPGQDADLVILDGDRVRATMVGGEWVHGQPRAS